MDDLFPSHDALAVGQLIKTGKIGARELLDGHVAQVGGQAVDVRRVQRTEDALGEQSAVQAGHLVPGGGEDRRHHRSQVALMSGEQYAHAVSSV